MKAIIDMFPDAKFIHIIRDGRDSALSMFKRKYDFNVYNTYHAAKYWQQYVEVGQKSGRELGSEAYFEIRYEDILTDAVSSLKRLCGFLEEEYSDALVNFRVSTEPGKTPLLQKPIQKDNIEKWRRLMTSRQVSVFEGATGGTLALNRYEIVTGAKLIPLPLRVAYRMHNKIATWHNSKFNTSHR